MARTVDPNFLRQKKTLALARWLLGKYLVRHFANGRTEARMITEVEAYNGEKDLACHARAGRTIRTAPLYAAGGIWYVYLCYGIHEMLNLVVGPADWPAALLIRGVEGAAGPGRVTKALQIDRRLNATSASSNTGNLWLEDRGVFVPRRVVETTPRIGVDYAGPIWSKKHWRFHFDPRKLSSHARLTGMPNPASATATTESGDARAGRESGGHPARRGRGSRSPSAHRKQ